MSRVLDAVLPARMGTPFRWLVGSAWAGNRRPGPRRGHRTDLGVTGPFWFAFVGSAILLALIWRELAHIAHADEQAVDRA